MFCICEAYMTITVESHKWSRGKSDPQAGLRVQNSKSDPEWEKQARNYSELVCKMDNISVIKVTRVVIVSKVATD